ncbi:MAG TPA: M14 family zinc carboxypeptidase [Candidatus Eremiobacteraeota bacterium]|mgnify:CR=1 FL=1|nr:MAG: Carboxypeptidase T precursor [bacterium ADurb.Bin363]HPZ08453.1 M14 family zinc carboxypeptidase [Candidatus Eremiobacteraeota bacterium]
MEISQNKSLYTLSTSRGRKDILPERNNIARDIDTNKNFNLTDGEIKDYLIKENILKDPSMYDGDEKKIISVFKESLQSKTLSERSAYHSYDEVIKELKELEAKYPNLAQTVSLGKTAEGREVMALKISKDVKSDTGNKIGFLVTGTHHAREWMALEAPLNIAKELVINYEGNENVKKRVDNAEIWIVPLVNPDGYEYSRNEYAFWRKNRQPIHKDDIPPQIAGTLKPDPNGIVAYGVDPNRNYYDGKAEHFEFYRPPGDTPESTQDDMGGGWWFSTVSDNPRADTYRGPQGASEKEIKAMLNFWLNKQNIKGIVNHHSYGQKIMYPYGSKEEVVPNKEVYMEIGKKMQEAMKGQKYSLIQSSELYPASGDPDDVAQLNDKLSFTIEIGTAFHEKESQIEPISKDVYNMNMAFLDWLVEHKDTLMAEKTEKKNPYNMPDNIDI